MGTKKGRKHFGDTIINEVLQMVKDGKPQREIAEFYGFESGKVVKQLLNRYRKKQRLLSNGILPRAKGRPRKDVVMSQDYKDNQIKRLEMENKLLRDFLHLAGRK